MTEKRQLIDPTHPDISVIRQCELVGLNRSSLYYQPASASDGGTELDMQIMRLIDEEYTRHPFYGSRRICVFLNHIMGQLINRKRVQRLMRIMGIQGVAPGPSTSQSHPEHKIYPYLLRNLVINRPNQVWSTDITFIPMAGGYMYLVAIIDWYSRYVLSWRLSNTMDTGFCIDALEQALAIATPDIFNTDQGSQFTSTAFTTKLLEKNIRISMDGRGRALDNIFVERLWRTVKYENIYMHDYATVEELKKGLTDYFLFYNTERYHQSLNYETPQQWYSK